MSRGDPEAILQRADCLPSATRERFALHGLSDVDDTVAECFELTLQTVECFVAHRLEPKKRIARMLVGANELVEFEMHGVGIAVLRVLDEEHHEKSHDGSSGIDDELPRVREVKERPRRGPEEDDHECDQKGMRPSNELGGSLSKFVKPGIHPFRIPRRHEPNRRSRAIEMNGRSRDNER
jgi:hypothetical protein